ncbi:MAG TPA: hypothetical protein VFR36_09310 [Sphingomicrobium sp.]|nr:hypothetical protein [Sphingomicrobium sp.]
MAELVLEGGKRLRQVNRSHRSWTTARQRAFLEALATSCNVKLAAQMAGVSTSQAYVRRGKDATFRAGWDQALATGYAQLEMMMLERALHGVEKTVIARDGTTTVMREYSDRVGLALLRMHRDSAMLASEAGGHEEYREACDRIIDRLERMKQQGEVETKGAADRIAVIGWALNRRR